MVQAQAGKLRIRRVTSAKRLGKITDVPALAETLPSFEAVTNMFVMAPPMTSATVVERLAAGFRSAPDDAEMREFFLAQGATVDMRSPEALRSQMTAESRRWPEFMRSLGIRLGSV
jgi:tripartite-type tricarboxylate transporter receptor subunit TctC